MNLRRSNLFNFISSIFNRWNFPVGKVDDFSYYIGMFWEGFKQPLKLYSLFDARSLARTCYLASSKMAFDSIHISIYPLIQCLNQLTIPFFEQCYALSLCTRFSNFGFWILFQTRKKIEFKTNLIFFRVWAWFLLPV